MHVAVVGGSDAGIEAARRVVALQPTAEVTVFVADAYPNFSICGIPYYVAGAVGDWRNLDRRTLRYASVGHRNGDLGFDRLMLGTGAHPVVPPIDGLRDLGPDDGVFVLHTMDDTFAINDATGDLSEGASVAIVGAGYVEENLIAKGVDVRCHTAVQSVGKGTCTRLRVRTAGADTSTDLGADLVLVSAGVRPSTDLAVAAGDCVHTHHRLLPWLDEQRTRR